MWGVDPASELRAARVRAGLSQRALAAEGGTSQATLSAYESGRKQPSVAVLHRLLAVTGAELRVVDVSGRRTPADFERAGRHLAEALELAETLPFRRAAELRYPRLPGAGAA